MTIEKWKPIEGYEDLYEVSNLGRIKRLVGVKARKERILKGWNSNRGGYPVVALCKDSKKKNHLIHRIVAKTFIDNPNNRAQVNHIDGNPKNNSVSNLEWVTNQENTIHAYENRMNTKTSSYTVLNLKTKESKEYHSARSVSLSIGKSGGWMYWAVKTKGTKFKYKNYLVEEFRKVGDIHV